MQQSYHMVLYIVLPLAVIVLPAISRPTRLESAEIQHEPQDHSPTALPQSSVPKGKKSSSNKPSKSSSKYMCKRKREVKLGTLRAGSDQI